MPFTIQARPSRLPTGDRRWGLQVERSTSEHARVVLSGAGRRDDRLPDPNEVWREMQDGPPVQRLTFDTSRVTD